MIWRTCNSEKHTGAAFSYMHRVLKGMITFLVFSNLIFTSSVVNASLSARFRVCSTQGTVTVQISGSNTTCPLERNGNKTRCQVFTGSALIKTGSHDYADIEFADSSGVRNQHIHLAPDTTIRIEGKYILVKGGNGWFKLERATMRLAPQGRRQWGLIIRTPTTGALRGSLEDFFSDIIPVAEASSTPENEINVIVRQDGSCEINVLNGECSLSPDNNRWTIKVSRGQSAVIDKNSNQPKLQNIAGILKNKWWENWPTLVPINLAGQGLTVSGTGGPASQQCQGNSLVVHDIQDAYVYAYSYRNWNRSNRGKYDQLVAGWHPTGGESRAYIKFDLSRVSSGNIDKATLKLYHFQTSGNNGVELGIYRVTSPWNEGSDTYHSGRNEKTAPPGDISWVQQPKIAPTPVATFNPGTGMHDWVEVDITSLVKKWLTGTPNYGLVIKPTGYLGRNISASTYHFASRERNPELDQPKGISKAPELILSENSNVNNGITQPPQKIPDTGTLGGNSISPGVTSLPFYENFDNGASRWSYPTNAVIKQGKFFWNTGTDFKSLRLKSAIPLENIIVEFDGYAETNGFGIHLVNDKNIGYVCIFGGWFNTKSGSDVGGVAENRQLVAGKVWEPKKWSHYKIVRSGRHLSGYCDNRLIFDRIVDKHYSGYGNLYFDSWNALIGIDNIRIYKADKIQTQAALQNKLVSGTYHVKQGSWESTWRLRVTNGQITGTSEWACCPGRRVDPMMGTVNGNSVVIERDCSGQGYNGACRQTFAGRISNNRIEGTCTGTGLGSGGTWVLYPDKQQ